MSKTKENNDYNWKELGDTATLSGMALNDKDLIKRYKVDMNIWEVDRMEIKENKWAVTMSAKTSGTEKVETKYNPQRMVKISFKRKKEVFDHKKFAKNLMARIRRYSPKVARINYPNYTEDLHLLEISLVDIHYDKLGWEGETGQLSYDTKIAAERMLQCTQAHLDHAIRSGVNIEQIIFVTSQDFFNSDSDYPNSSTTKGTPQQTDLRWQKSFHSGWQLNIKCIEMCKKIAPVTVVNVPGNHDFQKSYYLGEVLAAYYQNDENVDVNNHADPQRFVEYGKCLIGFAHNISLNRLKLLMQDKVPEAWGRTYFREWHLGDIHHSKKVELLHEDYQGLMIRWLKSLSGDDGWHNNEGYRSIKGGESFLWNKKYGMVNNYHYNLVLRQQENSFKI